MVSPADLCILAKESKLIASLGPRVLRLPCEAAQRWDGLTDTPVNVAVNLSAKQFSDGHLIASLRRIFDEVVISPTRLESEVTENTLMHDVARSVGCWRS